MGIFDEDNVISSMDKEVINATNIKNNSYHRCIYGWLDPVEPSFSCDKSGELKMTHKSTYTRITIHTNSIRKAITFNLEISPMCRYEDKSGRMVYKILNPRHPVFINSSGEAPDCFILEVPKDTKEVTFISCLPKPLKKLPKVKGNVKVTYINRETYIKLKNGEKISISKWWNGHYENR